jgi:hypothetical protein
MSWLKDLSRPGHCDGDGGTKSEANYKKADVAAPSRGVRVAGVGGDEKAGYLQSRGDAEPESSLLVKVVTNRRYGKNPKEVAYPMLCSVGRETVVGT